MTQNLYFSSVNESIKRKTVKDFPCNLAVMIMLC